MADELGQGVADDLRQRCIDALVAEFLIDSESAAPLADEVLAVRDEELARLREERDQAIAHDRQPYPTAWAYEQACKALNSWRERAETAEATVARVRAALSRTVLYGPNAAPAVPLAVLLAALDTKEGAVGE